MRVDEVIFNGRVRTLDRSGSLARAIAVADGRIVAVGRDDEVLALASSSTKRIDVAGRTVLPAFVDTHTHLRRASLVLAYYIDFMAMRPSRLDDVLEAVRARAAQLEDGAWIQGDSLDPRRLDVQRFPTRYELDAVASGHPVVLRSVGRHVVAANSLALHLAGITKDTECPSGGRIERDEYGHPTGVLHERAKLRLDATRSDSVIPVPSEQERVAALSDTMALLHSYGIACVHEMAQEPNDIGDYLRLREVGGLGVRVRFYIRGIEAQTKLEYVLGLGLRSEFGDEWIRLGGIKFSIDGSVDPHNAALYDDYPGEPGNTGLLRIEPSDLLNAVGAAHSAGLQVAIHAIGPRAVDIAMDACEAAARDRPSTGLHHRIEHAHLPLRSGQLERMAKLGLIWSTQPAFLYEGAESWAEIFGEQRCQSTMPLKTAGMLGLRIQINSDYPNASINPFVGLQAAVSRTTERGNVFGAPEAIPIDTALRYMTNAAANSTSLEGLQGSIVPGNFADVIVTEQDPYDVPAQELAGVEVAMTMVGGYVAYRREGVSI